jgi:hypothetical protein
MPKSKIEHEPEQDEAVIMERMNKALKTMMSTPPETYAEMVKRRHAGHKHKVEPKRRKADAKSATNKS